jgi:hypothetical protein
MVSSSSRLRANLEGFFRVRFHGFMCAALACLVIQEEEAAADGR